MERLSKSIWDEWVNLPCVPDHVDELAGMLEVLPKKSARGRLCYASSKLVIMRRLVKLWREGGAGDFEIHRDNGKITFIIDNESAIGIVRTLRSGERRNWAWMRGVWGARGSLYMPQSGYYMTFRTSLGGTVFERAKAVFKALGIDAGSRAVHNSCELMLRNQSDIVTVLAKMGLIKSSLSLEETSIMRSVKNQANKLVNCDSANINKSVLAAQRQMAIVEELDRQGIVETLPPPLKELVAARRANPSASLRELGQELMHPISKSTVEYRWRKLESLIAES